MPDSLYGTALCYAEVSFSAGRPWPCNKRWLQHAHVVACAALSNGRYDCLPRSPPVLPQKAAASYLVQHSGSQSLSLFAAITEHSSASVLVAVLCRAGGYCASMSC